MRPPRSAVCLPPGLTHRVDASWTHSPCRGERSPLADLKPRELEVLAPIAEGKSNAAISAALVLTKRAVEKHINAIFLKLNLSHSQSAEDISPRVEAALVFLAQSDRS
jgi:DNA-binding NarL/FixJ family response regulator